MLTKNRKTSIYVGGLSLCLGGKRDVPVELVAVLVCQIRFQSIGKCDIERWKLNWNNELLLLSVSWKQLRNTMSLWLWTQKPSPHKENLKKKKSHAREALSPVIFLLVTKHFLLSGFLCFLLHSSPSCYSVPPPASTFPNSLSLPIKPVTQMWVTIVKTGKRRTICYVALNFYVRRR